MTNEGGTAGILVPVTIVTGTFLFAKQRRNRSEERREGKSVDLGCRRIIKNKKKKNKKEVRMYEQKQAKIKQ